MKKIILPPSILAVSAVLLFSTGGLGIKILPLAALPISGIRALAAALFLGAYLFWQSRTHLIPRISRAGAIGAVGYVIMTVSYVASMKMTTAANAIFLQYTMPAWVLIGGALWLGESITWGRIGSILLSLLGMTLFFVDELTPDQWIGNILSLISGVGYAVVALALRKDRKGNPVGSVFWGNALTALFIIPIGLYFSPETISRLGDWRVFLGITWLGIFQIGAAYLCFVSALKHLPAIEVAIISLIEPIFNPLWVFLFYDEKPGRWSVLGGFIILFSVILRNFLRRDEENGSSKIAEIKAE